MAAVQTEFSLWTRNVELGVLETTRSLGIALVAFSPLGRGALTGKIIDPDKLGEKDLRRTHPRFNAEHWPHNRRLIDKFVALARTASVQPGQLALAWVLAQGQHLHAIPGTTDFEHLRENWATLDTDPGSAIIQEAGAIINQATVSGDRYPASMSATIDTEDYDRS
jgi:aryl-alcohol dehydrogenase-like predicted oxidoreductase